MNRYKSNKMFKNIVLLILIAIGFQLSISSVFAQDVPFEKGLFKERKDEFKIAKDQLEEGYKIYEIYPESFMSVYHLDYRARASYYKEALPILFEANKFNPNNAQLNYRIGRCYLASSIYKEECLTHFLKAQQLNPNVSPDIYYFLGMGYQLAMDFDKAIANAQSFINGGIGGGIDNAPNVDGGFGGGGGGERGLNGGGGGGGYSGGGGGSSAGRGGGGGGGGSYSSNEMIDNGAINADNGRVIITFIR